MDFKTKRQNLVKMRELAALLEKQDLVDTVDELLQDLVLLENIVWAVRSVEGGLERLEQARAGKPPAPAARPLSEPRQPRAFPIRDNGHPTWGGFKRPEPTMRNEGSEP